ncbi:EAL domain-containing protein, partial [Aduncisulcus paluster]
IEFNISYKKHDEGDDIEETYHHAKLALTYAKTRDSLAVVTYDERLEHILKEESILRERLERALSESKFEVHYQPKVSAVSKAVVSVEALARWHDDLLGDVSPIIF